MKKAEFIKELISSPYNSWDESTMKQISKDLDLDPNYYLIIFKDGIPEIMDYYDSTLDNQMEEILRAHTKPEKIRDRIALALSIRLKLDTRAKRSLKLKSVWRSCDIIWKYAGDKSIDFNYYSKRTLLSAVYIPSFHFYKKDNSLDYIETEEFIKSALERVIKIFSIKSKLPKAENIPILRLFL